MNITALVVGGIIIFTALVVFIILFIFLYQKRYYHYLQEKEQLKAQFSQESLQAQLEIQEQTFKNIAQEIHDNIGQGLTLAKLNLSTIDMSNPVVPQEKITNTKNLVSKAIQELRDLSKSMNTDNIMALGLYRAIENELELINKTGAYATQLTLQDGVPRMDPKRELIIFRIVQESLNNIIKHARATRINVSITYTNKLILLTIADNGNGFDQEAISQTGSRVAGMGLRNMQSRSRLIHADFDIKSQMNEGTVIRLSVPLNQ
jgi:two-component system, NarL family, sensor kinase